MQSDHVSGVSRRRGPDGDWGLQPGAAMEPGQLGMRRHASAWIPVRKRPDTLILTFSIRIFRSPSLSVKLASGARYR